MIIFYQIPKHPAEGPRKGGKGLTLVKFARGANVGSPSGQACKAGFVPIAEGFSPRRVLGVLSALSALSARNGYCGSTKRHRPEG